MRKKFFTNASIFVVGSSLLALVASIIYFAVSLNIDDGTTLMIVLIYVKDILNCISMFVGYATIAYAFFKFGFYECIMSFMIFIASILPHLILQIASWNTLAEKEYDIVFEGSQVLTSVFLGIYNSIGEAVINQVLPALLMAFLACKIIRTNKDEPSKIISWKNRSQRTMIIFCMTMTLVNIALAFVFQYLPILIEVDFVMTASDFKAFVVNVLLTALECLIIYAVIAYAMFMLTYKLYNYLLTKEAKKK